MNSSPSAESTMRCMEIHGGSHAVTEWLSMPGLEAWVYSRPHEEADAGGDVHYVSLCAGGILTRLILADVSGHGAAVAEVGRSLRELMRQNINRKSQTRLVAALNRAFAELAEMRRFATAVVATYLATKRRLTVCNAGHPRPLLYRAASRQWAILEPRAERPGNLPLGIDDASPYAQFGLTLEPGDLVVFYTDALTEAADGDGRMLGEEGLLALARALDPADFRGLGPGLIDGAARHRGGRSADDDETVVALHHTATGPKRASIGEKLEAYAKVLGLRKV